eukprot:GHVQ01011425.1.p3 GENE.GHVQ01011425.1~~GHVQ01011425.1.p3  ORF type:complete len:121 (+),score=22.60 GHVQ01011425.1:897-1259(+)
MRSSSGSSSSSSTSVGGTTGTPSSGGDSVGRTDVEPTEAVVNVLLKQRSDKSVKWNEDTAKDNEMLNKQSSKCCCVYHKHREFGESSSESSGTESGKQRPKKKKERPLCSQPASDKPSST